MAILDTYLPVLSTGQRKRRGLLAIPTVIGNASSGVSEVSLTIRYTTARIGIFSQSVDVPWLGFLALTNDNKVLLAFLPG